MKKKENLPGRRAVPRPRPAPEEFILKKCQFNRSWWIWGWDLQF